MKLCRESHSVFEESKESNHAKSFFSNLEQKRDFFVSLHVNLLTSWEEFRSYLGRFGLFDVAIQCRAGPRNVQISSHEVSKFTQG
jgi:hypothetical protein